MNRWGVLGSVAVVLAANAFVLIGVAIDRSGGVVQKIELTERELPIWGASEDNTGVSVHLLPNPGWRQERRFDRAKLTELGFDCSIPPEDPSAEWRYRKIPPRQAFVVLEYDGVAWQRWLAGEEQNKHASPDTWKQVASRLVPVDAAREFAALHERYPDRTRFLIAPALIRLRLEYEGNKPTAVAGYLEELLVSEIHVPQPYARTLTQLRGKPYHLTLCYGKRYEPWVCGCRP